MAAWQAVLLVAAAVGAAAWLFFLKVRPPRVAVPSLLLWRRVLDEQRDLTWWERIRRAVSLAATIVIAAALALAVTRPGPKVAASTRGRLLIVLDSSWSMLAQTSTGETRWERARRQARQLAAAAAGDDVALATTGGGLVEGPTGDLALIETALDELAPHGGDTGAWPRVSGTDSVHFITDGAVDRPIDPDVTIHSVYEAAPNVAIVAFEVRPATAAGEKAQAYLEIGNYSPQGQVIRYTITRGTAVVLDTSVDLAAGVVGRQVVPLDVQGDARLRVRVNAPNNALKIDDDAVAWMHGTEPLKVAVVSENPGPLALLLRADPSISPTFLTPATYRPGRDDVDRVRSVAAAGGAVAAVAVRRAAVRRLARDRRRRRARPALGDGRRPSDPARARSADARHQEGARLRGRPARAGGAIREGDAARVGDRHHRSARRRARVRIRGFEPRVRAGVSRPHRQHARLARASGDRRAAAGTGRPAGEHARR